VGVVRADLNQRHRRRRDLRHAGVVRLAKAGGRRSLPCPAIRSTIASDTYLPRRTEVAPGGIEAWEHHDGDVPSKIVQLAAIRQNADDGGQESFANCKLPCFRAPSNRMI